MQPDDPDSTIPVIGRSPTTGLRKDPFYGCPVEAAATGQSGASGNCVILPRYSAILY